MSEQMFYIRIDLHTRNYQYHYARRNAVLTTIFTQKIYYIYAYNTFTKICTVLHWLWLSLSRCCRCWHAGWLRTWPGQGVL